MQMIQDGQYASAPEKPLRMTGSRMACQVSPCVHTLLSSEGREVLLSTGESAQGSDGDLITILMVAP